MTKVDITQKDIDKFLVNTIDEFWETFHQGLKAPFSFWNEHKNDSKESWIQTVKRSKDLVNNLNLIFENTPLLKGEFPVANYSFMLLTNYRLFVNMNTGLVIIPLKDLTFYGEILFHGEKSDESSTIEYKKNGKTSIIRLQSYLGGRSVEDTVNANECNDLDDVSKSLLSMTYYDYEKKNLNPPKLELLKSKSSISFKNVGKMNIKKWGFIGVGVLLVYLFWGRSGSGNDSLSDSGNDFNPPTKPNQIQVEFIEELDKRITDFYKRKDSVREKVFAEKNKFKNPGVNWNEYHDFLYEQLKWLTNTSYNKFYKSNVEGWHAKVIKVSSFRGRYEIECNLGEYRTTSKKLKVGFSLLTYSSKDVTIISSGDWVEFNGSWNIDYDFKPVKGHYDKTVTNYIDGVEMPTMFGGFNRTEKDIGLLSSDHSDDPNKPEQTDYAEALLNNLYHSDWDDQNMTFFIDISSITVLDD